MIKGRNMEIIYRLNSSCEKSNEKKLAHFLADILRLGFLL
jgi:hypothetical protein